MAIRPGLGGGPLDRVVAVSPLILLWTEISIRVVLSANVLDYDGVATLDSMLESGVLQLRGIFPGRPVHQDRDLPPSAGRITSARRTMPSRMVTGTFLS